MLRLGWFSTGRGEGSRRLLRTVMEHRERGELDVDLAFVFCNWDNEEEQNPRREQREKFFELVRSYDIPLVTLSWKGFRPDLWKSDEMAWRDAYGEKMRRLLEPYPFDLGILAGYMLWMDDETCQRFDLINLHPALPDGPKGTWQEVIWELIDTQANDQGSMMHICTPEWDRGAPLTYCRFPIRGEGYDELWEDMERKRRDKDLDSIRLEEGVEEPLFKKIRADGFRRELPLILESIRLFAAGEVRVKNQSLYEGDRRLEDPYDLSADIDRGLTED